MAFPVVHAALGSAGEGSFCLGPAWIWHPRESILMVKSFFPILAILFLVAPINLVTAQDAQPDGPYYIVQEGDSLWDIAARFGVSQEDLQITNRITDPSQLKIGTKLIIPGLEGYQGRLDTTSVPFGETIRTLGRRYHLPVETLIRLNHLTSPSELFVGAQLIVPQDRLNAATNGRASLAPGQSLLELSVLQNTSLWTIAAANNLTMTWAALPGDPLQLPTQGKGGPGALPEEISAVELTPLPLSQGKTLEVKISGEKGLTLSGSLAGQVLNFFPYENGYIALQGIHTMTKPGLYQLVLMGTLPNSSGGSTRKFTFSQPVLVRASVYATDPLLTVDPKTVDPAVTKPEDDLWARLGIPVTPQKMWDGLFKSPVPPEYKDCWTSRFGNRRSFNGSGYIYFHSGLDFCGGIGTGLYAPAAGKVVFTGSLTVRGNVTVIDHGWGVYTAYDHQSQIYVNPGDLVSPGQLIGLGGATGRTTGPHLHWEVWVGEVQVDPVDWLQRAFP